MPRYIVNYPDGTQRDEEYEGGGDLCSEDDSENIVWCWDDDGDPPVTLSIGYMERLEKIEYLVDENGKRQYEWLEPEMGDQKKDRRKVPIRHLVVYLRNNRLGKVARSNRKPKRLSPES
jgi:hypothetical protein